MPLEVKQAPPPFLAPPWQAPRAAYVHIPFCVHRCHYCDFAVVAGRDELADRYLDALLREVAGSLPPGGGGLGWGGQDPARDAPPPRPSPSRGEGELNSLFLGGGTPTQLTAAQLDRLFTILHHQLPLARDAEISIEANPDGLTDEKIAVLRHHGVNRVTLGIQSFQPELLRFLERRHTVDEAVASVDKLLSRFRSVGVDLIFGVPGQSLTDWHRDLQQAIDQGVPHVSTYGLTYEKGTRLWKSKERGIVLPMAEDTEAEMYGMAMELLTAAGFEQYELSNFARPGHRCRHNETYWANHAYWGFGLGAARYIRGVRSVNTRSFDHYLTASDPTQSSEELPQEERARETAMLNLRRAEGIQRSTFKKQTGLELETAVGPALRRHVERGNLLDDDAGVRLTRLGRFIADTVMGDLLSFSVAPTVRRGSS